MEKYVIKAKDVFSKYIDVQIVVADSNETALRVWKKLNGQLGINVDVRYIEDSIKVYRANLVGETFFRDVRLSNCSTTNNHNFGLSTNDQCDNVKDKDVLTMAEAKRYLSKEEYNSVFRPVKEEEMLWDADALSF